MSNLFEIIKITDRNDNDRLDGRYPLRIGRRCRPQFYGCGYPVAIEYIPRDGEDYYGTLHTSKAEEIEASNGIHKVTTKNSIYYFKELF